jgi:hypothetical protein
LPETVAVPTVVPPLVHVVGALACGPNTSKVIVPPGAEAPLPPPDSTPVIEPAEIAALVGSVAGAPADVAVLYLITTVFVNAVVAVQDEWYLAVILYS